MERKSAFAQYRGSYKGHISESFLCYPLYNEGHFSWRENRLLLHIASTIRGISQERFAVTLCKVKGIFLGEQIGFFSTSRLLKGAYLRNVSFFLCVY